MKKKWIIVIVVGLVIVSFVVWLLVTSSYVADKVDVLFGEKNGGKAEFLKFLTTVIAGVLAFFALFYNAKRTKALDDQNAITEKGKVDERFKNAIEHLGSESPTIVLGGIYSMHRIAQERPDEYRKSVFEILCSFLREKTANQKLWADMTEEEQRNFKTPITIQSCIDLLFKYTDEKDYPYKGLKANLKEIRCPKADFRDAHLQGALLWFAHFEGADLWFANLEGARLFDAHLEGANLMFAHFEGAILMLAHLEGKCLDGKYYNGAYLQGAHLEGACLEEAHLKGAHLERANLEGATMRRKDLEGVDLTDVDTTKVIWLNDVGEPETPTPETKD